MSLKAKIVILPAFFGSPSSNCHGIKVKRAFSVVLDHFFDDQLIFNEL